MVTQSFGSGEKPARCAASPAAVIGRRDPLVEPEHAVGQIGPERGHLRSDGICSRSPAISAAAGRWPIRPAVMNSPTCATLDRWVSSQARYCTGNGATIAPIRTMARNATTISTVFGSWTPTTSPVPTPSASSTCASRETCSSSCGQVSERNGPSISASRFSGSVIAGMSPCCLTRSRSSASIMSSFQ